MLFFSSCSTMKGVFSLKGVVVFFSFLRRQDGIASISRLKNVMRERKSVVVAISAVPIMLKRLEKLM